MKRLTKDERERIRQYKADKAAMLEKAMKISVEVLKAAVIEEYGSPCLPYIVLDCMLEALEIKLGRKEYNLFIDSL